jgi:hypothetical protein
MGLTGLEMYRLLKSFFPHKAVTGVLLFLTLEASKEMEICEKRTGLALGSLSTQLMESTNGSFKREFANMNHSPDSLIKAAEVHNWKAAITASDGKPPNVRVFRIGESRVRL